MKKFLRYWKKYFVFAALLSCFINFLGLTFTFYMYTIYDVIVTSFSEQCLFTITVIALYAIIFLCLFTYLRQRLLNSAGISLEYSFSPAALRTILKIGTNPVRQEQLNPLQDIKTLRDFFSSQGMFALFDAPWAPFYFAFILYMHTMLGIISIGGSLLIFMLSLLQERLCQGMIISANRTNSVNINFLQAIFANSDAVLAMGMQLGVLSRWKNRNDQVIHKQTIASKRAGVIQAIFKSLQTLIQISIYGVGAYYVIMGQISAGIMIIASILQGQANKPVIQFMYAYRNCVMAWNSYRRLSQFMFVSEQIEKQKNTLMMPPPQGNLLVSNVSFIHGNRLILHNVSFSLNKGEFLGIIGPSGAGKSTLIKILAGLWPPVSGAVYLDGHKLSEWDKKKLGEHLGYVPQEVHLLAGTVEENITRFRKTDRERLEQLMKETGIDQFIHELPDGIHTRIDDNELLLSGGQKQRVVFARALYSKPALLILDEPNSNLDDAGEKRMITCLQELKNAHSTTCILVSHTPSILSLVDKILVLKNGRCVDFGPGETLLKRHAIHADLK